jgi:electron-transferring-flavoprotein dehydrogenase
MSAEPRRGLISPPERPPLRPARPGLVRPSNYPPPFSSSEALAEPTDPQDERIEVGVLIVGGGPAGLACAIRLAQLLEGSPEIAERLGEVPIAVLDKGRQPGSHLLSGAVVNPRSLRRLFRGRKTTAEMPFYGPVEGESVLFLDRHGSFRVPIPPTMRNHGNYVASLSRLGRWMAEEAEELGVTILPETAAEKLLLAGGARVVGARTGDKGRGRNGEPLANFEPGSDVMARITVLAEGTQGHLTGVAIDRFGLEGENPQVWALGVKEVWRVARPLRRVIHTMGWPLRGRSRYREFGGSFVYPMGDDMLTIGMVVGLDYRDTAFSVHDALQELKTHKVIRRLLDGGERIEWGAKTIPEGGFLALPKRLHAPGLLICGDGAGMVNVPALKGIHYAVESGRLAAEAAFAALGRGRTPWTPRALAAYDEAVRSSFIWKDLERVRNMRPAFARGFWIGGALATAATITLGRFPPRDARLERDAEVPLVRTRRDARYPAPDGVLTFDKLSSVFLSGNKTRDDAPDHLRLQRRVPVQLAELWTRMCPAQVYEIGEGHRDGTVDVEVTPSNCIQCGAITAKGGRLTPPEGGAGPEYKQT